MPCSGRTPEAMAKASPSGKATMPTISPETMFGTQKWGANKPALVASRTAIMFRNPKRPRKCRPKAGHNRIVMDCLLEHGDARAPHPTPRTPDVSLRICLTKGPCSVHSAADLRKMRREQK
jgi:hypothetical protein